ncbi:hypothetical protein DPEC_G00097550 [Dallia pectoralis]|uniref:Uncharacterized protein n=1 Tax=Dallia pectoralis TaxID=75939 RepID=A0ACC2GWA7_DALPE|nr:hypothetical protein DPEC_G00097550 [Dallia pectoralis]
MGKTQKDMLEQNPGMVPHLQDSSVPRPAQTTTNYNQLLKSQLIRKHLQQQGQKRQMEQMNGGQMTECQQGAPFTECGGSGGYPLGGPQVPHGGPLPPGPGRLLLPPGHPCHPSHPGPTGSFTQAGRPVGAYIGGPQGSKQPLYHPSQVGEFVGAAGMPMRQPQLPHSMMGMDGPAGPLRLGMQQQVSRTGMPIGASGLRSGLPPGHPQHPQHLRQALNHGGGGASLPRMMFTAQQAHQQQQQQQQQQQTAMWPQQQQMSLVSTMQQRMPCGDAHMDQSSSHQQSHGHMFSAGVGPSNGSCGPNPNGQFIQQSLRSGMPGGGTNNFTPHQGPPSVASNQGVGVPSLPSRLMQKLGVSVAGQPLPSMVHQGLQPGMRPRGPLSALAGMKPLPLGMIHHPAHGMAPPSYPASGAAVAKHPHPHQHQHPHGPGYGPGQGNPGHKLPPYEYPQQGQSNGGMGGRPGGGGEEADFIDSLVGSNEDWLNNLTMIDEYLEQNS